MIFTTGILCASKRRSPDKLSIASGGGSSGGGIVPAEPGFVALTGSTAGQKRVSWKAPEYLFDGSAISADPITGFVIYWNVGTAPVTPIPFDLDTATSGEQAASSSATFYDITGLTTGQELTVRVTAINASGESHPSPADTSTVP